MNKIFNIVLAICFCSSVSFAECDFSTGITKLSDSSFSYTKECHIKVGTMQQDLITAQQQNDKLMKAIDLKNVALTKSDERADLWMNTSFKLEDRVQTLGSMQKTNELLYFGLGALTIFASGIMASKLINH